MKKSSRATETTKKAAADPDTGSLAALPEGAGLPPEGSKAKSEPVRRTLPAFGFAADLLKPAPAAAPTPAPAAADPGENWLGVDEIDPGSPKRIFDFADRLAARAEEQRASGPKPRLETFLTFQLAGEVFAMPVEPVQQVVRISAITRVPHAPRPIRGVTNLRGRVIPVIDLRVRVGLPATELDRASRIIAVGSRGRTIGLLVDAVHQVAHLDLNAVQLPPEDVMSVQSDYIAGVYHHTNALILLLDIDRALILREANAA